MPLFLQAFQVEFDCIANQGQNFTLRFTRRDAARKIRNICPVGRGTLFNDDKVSHMLHFSFFSPACFSGKGDAPLFSGLLRPPARSQPQYLLRLALELAHESLAPARQSSLNVPAQHLELLRPLALGEPRRPVAHQAELPQPPQRLRQYRPPLREPLPHACDWSSGSRRGPRRRASRSIARATAGMPHDRRC